MRQPLGGINPGCVSINVHSFQKTCMNQFVQDHCETFICFFLCVVCVSGRSQPTLQTGGGDDSGSVVKYT